jgi:hypothetical protein
MDAFFKENERSFTRSSANTQSMKSEIKLLSHCLINSARNHHNLIMPSNESGKMSCPNFVTLETTFTQFESFKWEETYRLFIQFIEVLY